MLNKKMVFIFILVIYCLSGCSNGGSSPDDELQGYLKKIQEYRDQKNYDTAQEEWEKAVEFAESQYSEQSKELAEAYLKIAVLDTTFGGGEKLIDQAREIFGDLQDMEGMAKAYCAYGMIYNDWGNVANSQKMYKRALEYCDMAETPMSVVKFDICLKIGNQAGSRNEESLQYYLMAEKILEELTQDELLENNRKLTLYRNIATCYDALDQYEHAIEKYELGISFWEQYKGQDIESASWCYANCGYCYGYIGEYDKAIEYVNKAITLMDKIATVSLENKAMAYWDLAVIYSTDLKKDYDKALEYCTKVFRVYTEQYELSTDELEELKAFKAAVKRMYEEDIQAEQPFEEWYQEAIK